MCVCMYVCMYVCVNVCTYARTQTNENSFQHFTDHASTNINQYKHALNFIARPTFTTWQDVLNALNIRQTLRQTCSE